MATRWMRWNETTHIFEYSTDGVSFNPLPLNAATINEGSFPSSVLPANVAKVDLANVFTNALPISLESAAPLLQYKETDQAVDSRFWRAAVEATNYKIQSLSDALVATDLLSLSRAGALVLSQNTDHSVGGAVGATANRFRIKNTVAGAGRLAGLVFDTDTAGMAQLNAFTSGWVSSGGNIASGLTINCAGVGGLNLVAGDLAGAIQFFTGGGASPRVVMGSAGGASFFKAGDPTTIILQRNTTATSGQAEGGLMIAGQGIVHFGMGLIPYTGGSSRAYFGFGANTNLDTYVKNLQIYQSVVIPSATIYLLAGNLITGLFIISSVTHNKSALFLINASGSVVSEISDPGNLFSPTIGTASMINIYYNGSGGWNIQNLTGGQVTVLFSAFGYILT